MITFMRTRGMNIEIEVSGQQTTAERHSVADDRVLAVLSGQRSDNQAKAKAETVGAQNSRFSTQDSEFRVQGSGFSAAASRSMV